MISISLLIKQSLLNSGKKYGAQNYEEIARNVFEIKQWMNKWGTYDLRGQRSQ
jgi:hypothetical protein